MSKNEAAYMDNYMHIYFFLNFLMHHWLLQMKIETLHGEAIHYNYNNNNNDKCFMSCSTSNC